jgi:hypothetical protein
MNLDDLKAELQVAFADVLQDKWDEYFVDTWFQNKDYRLGRTLWQFAKKQNVDISLVYSLKRTGNIFISKMTVARVFAGYMPEINEMLWAGKPKEEILRRMRSTKFTEKIVDLRKIQQSTSLTRRLNKKAAAENQSHRLVAEQRERTSKYAWGVVK